jgi:hypothetical protein
MAHLKVTVTRSSGAWHFKGDCDKNGNMLVKDQGANPIDFVRGPDEPWAFQPDYIKFGVGTIDPKSQSEIRGVLQPVPGRLSAALVAIVDTNRLKGAHFYRYSLFTTEGEIDPMIVNDGP